MASDSTKTLFKPGQPVPIAGIYKVSHVRHRLPHKASFKAHDTFPPCNKCAAHVRFELLVPAEDGDANDNGNGNAN
jgi:hypothetical protein